MNENEDTVSFKGSDPGAAQYGNFINYYQFHPAEKRINALPTGSWLRKVCDTYYGLDIGCNAGNLTQSLYEFLEKHLKNTNCKLFAIDIDELLIERAILHNKYNENVIYKCVNIMNENERQVLLDNCLHERKFLNVIFCFSVTMWIHLNHGDDGLKKFLEFLCNITEILIIEPQPWKCYRTALKRMKKSNRTFILFQSLKIRENVENEIENIIINQKFIKIEETRASDWGRKILIFARSKSSC